MIIATCRHEVVDMDDVISVTIKEYTLEGNPCLSYVTYCYDCYYKALANDEVLSTPEAEAAWLNP